MGRIIKYIIQSIALIVVLGFITVNNNLIIKAQSLYNYQNPSAEKIISDLKSNNPAQQHPRIMINQTKIQNLKTMITTDSHLIQWYAALKASGDSLLAAAVTPYPNPVPPNDMVWTSRAIKSRIETLGLLYQLSGDARYAERAWLEMQAAANFPNWNPIHFLDTAEMTAGMGIGYDWLYHYLSVEQRSVIRNAIINLGLQPTLDGYHDMSNTGSWAISKSNWNIVCNGGIGIGALAIGDEDEQRCGEILSTGLKNLQNALILLAPDGGWEEGPTYWQYAIKYFTEYMSSLDSANGTNYGYADVPGIVNTGYFEMYMLGATKAFNFHDSNDPPNCPEMFWLSKKVNDKDLTTMRIQQMSLLNIAPGPYDLLWYNPDLLSSRIKAGLDGYFRDTETATFRSAWNDPNATYVGLHAGSNTAGHQHLDVGTFVLDAMGERWANDLGADNYALTNYFSIPQRFNYYRCRAEGHNTLIANPGAYPDQNITARPVITNFESQPDGGFAVADTTSSFPLGAISAKRGVMLTNGRSRTIIQDEVQMKNPSEFWWFMHTSAQITLSTDQKSAILTIGSKKMWVGITSSQAAVFSVMNATPLPTSPNPSEQNPNTGYRKLAIHMVNTTNVHLTVEFVPLQSEQTQPAIITPVKTLADWSLARPYTPKLISLTVDGVPVALQPDRFHYVMDLPADMDHVPLVKASGNDNVTVTVNEGLMAKIQVSARDDELQQNYVMTYTVDFPYSGRILANNDFENGEWNNGGLLSSMSTYINTGKGYIADITSGSKTGKCVVLESNASSYLQNPLFQQDFAVVNNSPLTASTTPIIVMEANIRTENIGIKRTVFSIRDNAADKNGAILAMIDKDGKFKLCDKSLNPIGGTEMGECIPGQWYHVMAVLNIQNNTYDFYIDGINKLKNRAISGTYNNSLLFFRFDHADGYGTNGSSIGGKYYIDDVKAYTPEVIDGVSLGSSIDLMHLDYTHQTITLNFNNAMDKSTLNKDNIVIRKTSDQTVIPYTALLVDARTYTLQFTSGAFVPDTQYSIVFPSGIKDAWGNPLGDNYQLLLQTCNQFLVYTDNIYYVVGNQYISSRGELRPGDVLKTTAEIYNSGTQPQNVILILALYKNNRLSSLNINSEKTVEWGTRSKIQAQLQLPLDFGSEYTVKTFVWKDLNGNRPIVSSDLLH